MPALKNSRPKTRAVAVAAAGEDPDHHLVSNRGFWWVCCSINATPRTKEKLSFSLRTRCLTTARLRRDLFLQGLQSEGLEVRLRRSSSVALSALTPVSPERMAKPWKTRVAGVLERALAANAEVDEAAGDGEAPEDALLVGAGEKGQGR